MSTKLKNLTIKKVDFVKQGANPDVYKRQAWQNQAEFLNKYFTKGMTIIAAGRISTHMWESESGKRNYSTDVTVSEISFGESKKMGQGLSLIHILSRSVSNHFYCDEAIPLLQQFGKNQEQQHFGRQGIWGEKNSVVPYRARHTVDDPAD